MTRSASPQGRRKEESREYWRSLERLLDSPAVSQELQGEFPPGAHLPPDAVTRRTAFHLMGASFALAGLAACRRPVEHIVPYVEAPENVVLGVPRHYATTMPLGTSAYGLVVENHQGRPTKIAGNELHPSSRGAANAWMQAAVLGLYDPDRSPRPWRRLPGGESGGRPEVGPDSRSEGEETTWQEFGDFWTSIAFQSMASGGEGIAILTEACSSPTLARLAAQFRTRFPKARWVVHEPVSDENLYEGLRQATGTALRPVYHLDRASTILALEADFLGTESDSLGRARGFAARRRIRGPDDTMSRLYVVENGLSITGAQADHRLALPSGQVAALVAGLVFELRDLGLDLDLPRDASPPSLPEAIQGRLRVLARDLLSARGEALVLAGRGQPPEVHVLVFALNQALGAVGRTLSLHPLRDVGWGRTRDLEGLVREMNDGVVSTLIVVGGNPVYTAPADLDFPAALAKVSHTVHLASRRNETSRLVEWHLPQSHFLESWGDARAEDGTASVIQPLIAPLGDSRSPAELLGLLVNDTEYSGLGLVEDTWLEEVLGGEDYDARWRKVLHGGVLQDSASPAAQVTLRGGALVRALETARRVPVSPPRAANGSPALERGLEIVFQVSPAVYDGRFANNGWLQELPDAVTKLTWDNAALMGPGTARQLGVRNGDVVRLTYGGRSLEAPVWTVPGQAHGSVILTLGYGRSAAGRVGDGVGRNAYQLRTSQAPHFDTGLQVESTGRTYELATTQEHWAMEGRALVREATVTEYRSHPDFASGHGGPQEPAPRSLWQEHEYGGKYQWGMAIDLNACLGCNACVVACQSENNVPIVGKEQVLRGREMHWLRVDRYFSGPPDDPQVAYQPVPCQHCENAPCEQVCPVGATLHDREGLNAMVYNRCIGTRYCSNNCPYKVRRFNFFNYTKDTPELVRMAMNPDVTVRSRGVMEKCSYCVQRLQEAKTEARRQGRDVGDGDVKTACQETCPAQAIDFGNLADPTSEVSRRKAESRNYTLLERLEHRPRTSYLAKLRNPNPDWEEA